MEKRRIILNSNSKKPKNVQINRIYKTASLKKNQFYLFMIIVVTLILLFSFTLPYRTDTDSINRLNSLETQVQQNEDDIANVSSSSVTNNYESDMNWTNITNMPSGFSDNIDNDTSSNPFNQNLNTTNSPTFNDITLTSYPNLDKDSTDDFSGSWADIIGMPAGFADGIDNTGGGATIESITGADYGTLQDWVDTTQSAGRLTGGTYTNNGDGTIDVAAGTGFIKTTDSEVGDTLFFNWAGDTLTVTVGVINHVYVDYNGGSPILGITTNKADITHNNVINMGKAFTYGTGVHYLDAGTQVNNLARRVQERLGSVEGFARVSGIVLSETGTRNIAITAGKFYRALNELTSDAIDTSDSDTFNYHFKNVTGDWLKTTGNTQIDNVQYNDQTEADGLSNLGVNDYGVHWVYVFQSSGGGIKTHVVYGVDSYNKLADAMDANSPSSVPDPIKYFGILIGKIIIERDASSFAKLYTAWEEDIPGQVVTDHGSLGGLSDDDHTQYLLLAGRGSGQEVTGYINATGGYRTDDGIGWSGWIDDGVNTNCTYSGGILINVTTTSGIMGYNKD